MATLNYVGWATNVNRIILDSTTISVGDGATKTDELENGYKRTKLRGSFVPKRYSVVMVFDWVEEDSYGETEYQRFLNWYEYRHKYGSIPFEFPSIALSPQTGIKVYDVQEDKTYKVEYYKITSSVEGSKSGNCIEVKMTWETVYGGVVTVTQDKASVVRIKATPKYMDIYYSAFSDTAPLQQNFTLYIGKSGETETEYDYSDFKGYYCDYNNPDPEDETYSMNSGTVRIYYSEITTPGIYTATFQYIGTEQTTLKDTFKSTFEVK